LSKFTRRLQKIGSSILVSLPKQRVDDHNLVKSSQVQIETLENSLSITAGEGKKLSKEIEIEYPLSGEENIAANITGAYLLGYDIIRINGKSTISVKDREVIRESMRRLVGMEILDEDASNITGQFLLDETSLNPKTIFKRMSSIALGMFDETLSTLTTGDSTNLQTIPNRDDEINRQYFLLVRFIRSTMVDRRLAGIFNLENIDILDYRIAGNILETAGDTIVDLSKSITDTSLSGTDQKKIYEIAKDIENILDSAKKGLDLVIIEVKDWKIIPLENIIAKLHKIHTKIFSIARNAKEARKMFSILDVGVDGVIFNTGSMNEVRQALVYLGSKSFELSSAKIIEIQEVGDGERVCVDTASMLNRGEGMLIGSRANFLFLVHNESVGSSFTSPRPFRVNAGAVHCYTLAPDGTTKYLSELETGVEILVLDSKGKARRAVIGRC